MMTVKEIADRFNLKRLRRSWRGRCPACDYPGTFSVRAGRSGRPLLYCASCQDQAGLADAVARATGQEAAPDRRKDAPKAATVQRKQEAALRLWRGSEPAAGTLAAIYLAARGLPGLAASTVLRFRGDTWHPEGGRYPAMVALVSAANGAAVAVHRTYLRPDGSGKADVEPARAALGPVWGGAVRLFKHDPDKPLVIGEGIETAASAGILLGLPAWAAISAGNMAKGVILPPEVRRLVIAADPDDAGRRAARDAWIRWRAEGREVRVATPDGSGDFNDLLRMRETAHG
jgi:putative DNA primase/helicase